MQLSPPSLPLPAAVTLPTKTGLAEEERERQKYYTGFTEETLGDTQTWDIAFGTGERANWSGLI